MKFKLDENLDHRLTKELTEAGHEADSVMSEGLLGHDDDEIYQACLSEGRILITLDLDFSTSRIHCVIHPVRQQAS